MALLEVRDLRVSFQSDAGLVGAVDGISFSLSAGEAMALVGESGAGKSVAGLTLLGLTRGPRTVITGEARLDGLDLVAAPDEQLRRVRGSDVAMVFQDPLSAMHPLRRVGDQLVEVVRAHQRVSKAAARTRAIEMLGLVGLPDPRARLRAYPHELSGGMRQRAMLAMALVNEPRLLIADEPTTALDVTVQAQVLDLIDRLRSELGTAVVLITHDLGVAARVSSRIAVMYAGRIVEDGPTATIFAAPEHPYTWGLLRAMPRLDRPRASMLAAIPGQPPTPLQRPSGCAFHPRCPHARPEHARIVPPLRATGPDGEHHVACLLDPARRRELWSQGPAGLPAAEQPAPRVVAPTERAR